jgi:hypothetical protein
MEWKTPPATIPGVCVQQQNWPQLSLRATTSSCVCTGVLRSCKLLRITWLQFNNPSTSTGHGWEAQVRAVRSQRSKNCKRNEDGNLHVCHGMSWRLNYVCGGTLSSTLLLRFLWSVFTMASNCRVFPTTNKQTCWTLLSYILTYRQGSKASSSVWWWSVAHKL